MTNTMRGFYIQEEAKKDFKYWEKGALEFVLRNYNIEADIKEKIKTKLKGMIC
jgi:hypothetical protein